MDRKKIMIVEDEGIVANEIRSRLKNLDYDVVGIADTAPGAIKMAGELGPDLVLMDIKLKGEMDGVDAAEVIRSMYDIPVVFLTAFTDEGTLGRAKITQPFGYLIKPFEERELRTTIEISLYNHMMEKKLQESEARYRAVSELSSDFAFSMRTDEKGEYHLEWITDAFSFITGYSIDNIELPRDLKKIIHPEDIDMVMDRLHTDSREIYNGDVKIEEDGFDFRLTTKGGEQKWMHGFLRHAIDGNDEHRVRCFGAVKDITEVKRAQDLIRIQRDLGISLSTTGDLTQALDRLLEATIQVSGIDCGGLYLMEPAPSGDGEQAIQGIERECLPVSEDPAVVKGGRAGGMDLAAHKNLPYQFIDILHYDSSAPQTKYALAGKPIYGHYAEISTPLDEIHRTDGLKALAMIPVKHKGKVVAALNLASHTHDDLPQSSRDALEAIASQVGGIIARVRAELALRENEEKYRSITETISEGILQIDTEGRIDYTNNAFNDLLGYAEGEVIGSRFVELFRDMHIPELNLMMEDVHCGNYPDGEMTMIGKDGNDIVMWINASPLRKSGTIMGSIMVLSRLRQ